MNFKFSKKFITNALLALVLIELLSFFAYFFDIFNTIIFFLLLAITLVLCLKKLEYGLYIVLTELFIGSTGYLFSLDFEGFSISLRMGLFLVVMAAWLLSVFKTKKVEFQKSSLFWWFWLFIIFLGWGLLNGKIAGHNFSDIFFDINAYIYFALIFVFFTAIKSSTQITRIFELMAASMIVLAGKSIFYYLVYAADLRFFSIDLYHWQRSTEGGQLAHLGHNLYRILFLSDIYALISIFIFGSILVFAVTKKIMLDKYTTNIFYLVVGLSSLVVVISFFRSFWAALLLTLVYAVAYLIYKIKTKRKIVVMLALVLLLFLALEAVIVFGVSQGLQKWVVKTDLVTQKDIFSSDDPGIVGRMNLLLPLWHKFTKAPVLGHGFGTTVSFLTTDPRHYNQQYITYAFEWGYFDIAIKIGIIGLLTYLIFIWKIFSSGSKLLYTDDPQKKSIIVGLLIGLVALILTHGVSPYLNHPLGIGYLLLAAVIFYVLGNEKINQKK